MKHNKIYMLILSALLPLLWLACSKETPVGDVNTNPVSEEGGEYPVTFSLQKGFLSSSPKTYATAVTASEGERKVSHMVALVFNSSDNKYIGLPLKVTVSNQTAEDSNDTDTKLTGSFDLGKKYGSENQQIKFLLVANVTVTEMQASLNSLLGKTNSANALTDLTLEDVKKAEISNAPDVQSNFVMVTPGSHNVTLHQNQVQQVDNIKLRRLSARIDTKIGTGVNNEGLTIEKVVVKKRQIQSYLVEKGGSTSHLSSDQEKEYSGLNVKNHTAYTYENSQVDDTNLVVTLALDGVTLSPIEVPFTDKAIERNHIYKVTFNRDDKDTPGNNPNDPNINAPKITFKVDVNDWEVTAADYVEDYANTDAPVIVKLTQKQANFTADANPVTATINTDNTSVTVSREANYIVADVHSQSTESEAEVTQGATWVRVNDVTTYAYGMKQQFQIEIDENGNPKGRNRTATIEFRNKLDKTQKIVLTITQKGRAKLALEYVAEYNLGTEGIMDNHDYDYSDIMNIRNNKQAYFSWNQAQEAAAELDYYHLPTREEWRGIVPDYLSARNVVFNSTRSISNVTERVTVAGITKSYTADYKSEGNGTIYGIKFKGYNDGMRTAYRYRLSGLYGGDNYSLIVECIYLGKNSSIDINNIEHINWDNPDVTRTFEAAGSNHINKVGYQAAYWSDTSLTETQSSIMFFDNNIVHTGGFIAGLNAKYSKLSVRLFKNY